MNFFYSKMAGVCEVVFDLWFSMFFKSGTYFVVRVGAVRFVGEGLVNY